MSTIIFVQFIPNLKDWAFLNCPCKILMSEKVTQDESDENTTWTFYKFKTMNGFVTLRWCGQSECYNVEVDFIKVK